MYFFREALFSVARRFFEEIELGGDEMKVRTYYAGFISLSVDFVAG
jgi:hypothetical protein